MDEFTVRRYQDLSKQFVSIYAESSPLLAAKMLVEANIPDKDLPHIRELIEREFLHEGWTFPEAADEGC